MLFASGALYALGFCSAPRTPRHSGVHVANLLMRSAASGRRHLLCGCFVW